MTVTEWDPYAPDAAARAVCTLDADCTLAAPDIFRIGDDGELEYDAEPTPQQEDAAREPLDACPSLAIELVDEL